jgi:hypothetical protein
VVEKMKKISLFIVVFLSLFLLGWTDQSCPELQIGLRRDFGYASGTGKIQGTFTISASGPQDLNRVIFYLDKNPLGDIAQPPFALRFSTDSYGLGEHTFSALGYTSSGCRLDANSISAVFVTAKEGWDAGLKIVVPILSLVLGITVLMVAATVFSSGLTAKKLRDLPPGAERKYGFAGGAICPRCKRPFARHILSPNMLVGKLERCPYCGKVGIVAAQSMQALRAAEAAELTAAGVQSNNEASPEEQLHKDLDDSRFQDL